MDPTGISSRPNLEAVRQRRMTLRLSMERLKEALAAAVANPTGRSCAAILGAAQDLLTCLGTHIEATEGPSGFHSDIVTAAPRLAHDIEILVREHSQLVVMVSDIVSLSGQECTPDNIDAIHQVGTRLFLAISRHLQHGSELIYEAFQSDLGGET